jgi:hypothetical protein
VRWRERDKPRKHRAICRVTSSKPPKSASLPPAWLHLTVTAWRLYGTRYPPVLYGVAFKLGQTRDRADEGDLRVTQFD